MCWYYHKGEVRRKMNFIYVLGFVVLRDVVKVFPVNSSSFARKTTWRNRARSHSGACRGPKTKWDLKLSLPSPTYLIRYLFILDGTTTPKLKLDTFQLWQLWSLNFQSFSEPSEIRWRVRGAREAPAPRDSLNFRRSSLLSRNKFESGTFTIVLHATSSFTYVSVIYGADFPFNTQVSTFAKFHADRAIAPICLPVACLVLHATNGAHLSVRWYICGSKDWFDIRVTEEDSTQSLIELMYTSWSLRHVFSVVHWATFGGQVFGAPLVRWRLIYARICTAIKQCEKTWNKLLGIGEMYTGTHSKEHKAETKDKIDQKENFFHANINESWITWLWQERFWQITGGYKSGATKAVKNSFVKSLALYLVSVLQRRCNNCSNSYQQTKSKVFLFEHTFTIQLLEKTWTTAYQCCVLVQIIYIMSSHLDRADWVSVANGTHAVLYPGIHKDGRSSAGFVATERDGEVGFRIDERVGDETDASTRTLQVRWKKKNTEASK